MEDPSFNAHLGLRNRWFLTVLLTVNGGPVGDTGGMAVRKKTWPPYLMMLMAQEKYLAGTSPPNEIVYVTGDVHGQVACQKPQLFQSQD